MVSSKQPILLNAGNLWTEKYLNRVIELNTQYGKTVRVKSIFGSMAKITPTARSADRLPYLGWQDTAKFIDTARCNDIKIRYTLNASCIGAIQDFKNFWDLQMKADLRRLHSMGVDEWTITSPLLMTLLRDMFPDDFLEVSTIAEIATPTDAKRWMALGANGVNLSTNINRDFITIRNIAAMGTEVSVLANEACLYRCPYRRECYNLSSHNSQRGEELFGFYPFRYCNEIRMRDMSEWLKARMILPQWMKIYRRQAGVNWFKVAYRTHPYEVAIPILEAYMRQEHNGNYLDLWPTVSHLGNTAEPQNMQYISCDGLDKLDFLSMFMKGAMLCNTDICGVDCRYCESIITQLESSPL